LSWVDGNGARLFWEATGEGEPVLLIQGLGLSAALWYRLRPLLARSHRVICYDARGTGHSDVPPGPYSIELMASDALAVLDVAGETSAHLFGLSLGGLVAQQLAISQADRIRSLILCGTVVGGAETVWADKSVLDMLQSNALLPPEDSVRASIPMAYDPETDRNRIEEDIARRLELPTSAAGYQSQLMGSAAYPGTKARLSTVTVPALVVTGDNDQIAPPINAQILWEALPNARIVVIPNAGHMVITDQPALLADAISQFIRSVVAIV
jgi:3-oxoadipate enol-lactonase